MADRKATTSWKGDITGGGQVSFDSSGAAGPLEVSFPRRKEDAAEGVTSPEELIAAAHTACYSMALAGALGRAGHTPESIETSAVVTFSTDGGPHISKVALTVRATIPGISEEEFLDAANGAKDGCPVSKLMAGNTELTLDAALA
jgi:osmotically inducible protein OsmC